MFYNLKIFEQNLQNYTNIQFKIWFKYIKSGCVSVDVDNYSENL